MYEISLSLYPFSCKCHIVARIASSRFTCSPTKIYLSRRNTLTFALKLINSKTINIIFHRLLKLFFLLYHNLNTSKESTPDFNRLAYFLTQFLITSFVNPFAFSKAFSICSNPVPPALLRRFTAAYGDSTSYKSSSNNELYFFIRFKWYIY